MTQIIGVVTRKCVFQVTDRLVSQKVRGAAREYDPNANKAVIFRATDGHVVVGYAGHAYVDGIPTDTFIAQSLLGVDLSGPGAFISVGFPKTWTNVGYAVERLRESLSQAFARMTPEKRRIDLQASVLGWRQRKGRNRRISPVVWVLGRRRLGESNFEVARQQRWWRWDHGFSTTTIPDLGGNAILEWMRAELRQHGGKSPEDVNRIIVDALRRCADERPHEVGRSCLRIMLTPAAAPHARIRYIVDTRSPSDLCSDGVGYSPWVVAPPMVFAPAVIRGGNGGWTNTQTGYSWRLEGVEPPAGPRRMSQSAQKRRSDPSGRP